MRLIVIGIIAVLTYVGLSSIFVVDETEQAIVTQFGNPKRTVTAPGLYFKTPLIQDVTRMESRILGSDTPPQEYLTLDKKRLVADPITRWRIIEPLTFYKTVHNEIGAKARLDDMVNSEMRRELASHNFGDIVGNARDPMMQKVTANVRRLTKKFGIYVVDVRIKRADLPKEVQESVYQRMRAERERVAKKYRAEGEREAAMIRAETDKKKTIILAEAYEKAQKLRGAGDSQSIQIYAEAYNRDPEFYSFVRSLEAYETSMTEKSSLVLSTNSDLFRYLADPKAKR